MLPPRRAQNIERTIFQTARRKELGIDLSGKEKETERLREQVKHLESLGFQYENAEASLELLCIVFYLIMKLHSS